MNIIHAEYIEDSIDAYIAKYSATSGKIYWLVLIVVVVILISLPFIYVDVSVQEPGIIRTIAEKTEIKSNITELVDSVFVKEGQSLNQGDTILTLRQSSSNYQIQYQQKNEYETTLFKANKDLYVIKSPVSGTIDQFRGIYKGSGVQAGSLLAIISPDSTLYAEVYVSPRNIGYIYHGMPVQIRVSSFNYNEWGAITGEVVEISSDFLTNDTGSEAYYKVKCSLEKSLLVRKNGVTGNLKKGMYVSSHFMITERSLFDLIYQKIDDRINPTQNNNNQFAQK